MVAGTVANQQRQSRIKEDIATAVFQDRQTRAMWFKKKETDIEMEAMRGQKRDTSPDDTDYRPINWKKVLFSPKYIRMRHFPADALL